jgi:hypothetical protein
MTLRTLIYMHMIPSEKNFLLCFIMHIFMFFASLSPAILSNKFGPTFLNISQTNHKTLNIYDILMEKFGSSIKISGNISAFHV